MCTGKLFRHFVGSLSIGLLMTAGSTRLEAENVIGTEANHVGPPWVWEISIAEIYLQSQENARYLASSSTNPIAAYPAVGRLIDFERAVADRWTVRGALLFPINQEVLIDREKKSESTHFTFTRAVGASGNYEAFVTGLGYRGRVELSPGFGLVIPLVFFGKDKFAIPEIHLKTRISSSDGAGLILEFGYAGAILAGTFFGRFGASYRL